MGAIVECYAGYSYPERPLAFLWEPSTGLRPGGERVEVEEIERQWRTPAGLAFRVRAADGRRFTLAYDEASDTWDVQPRYVVATLIVPNEYRSKAATTTPGR